MRWIAGLIGLLMIVLGGLYMAGLRVSPLLFYRYDGAAAVEAARGYDVEIIREAYGVPHIVGARDRDAAFGLAYAHAEDDFSTLEAALYAARGARAFAGTRQDAIQAYLVQLFRTRALVDERFEQDLSAEVRALVRGYADGLNYYAALHADEIRTDLFPITAEDVVTLTSFSNPLFYGMSAVLTGLISPETDRQAGRGQELQVNLLGIGPDTEMGSNGLAVAPARSPDGVTRLFVNSHQPVSGPLAWYEMRMKSGEGLDFAGGTFAGGPLPFHGHNAHLGWTSTINRPDLIDVYELTVNPDNENQYLLDGEWTDFESGEAIVTVKLWGPFAWRAKRKTLYAVHGPVLQTPKGAFAIRYATMDSIGFLEEHYRLVKARTLDDFHDALRLNEQGNANRIYADKQGNIAMFYVARMPKRKPGIDYSGIIPGDRSDLIWTEFHAFDDLPHVINPPEGFITEANSTPFVVTGGPGDPKAEEYPPEMGIETHLTNRAMRALALFKSDLSISREDFIAYKFDNAYHPSSVAARIKAEVLALDFSDDPALEDAQTHLRGWDLGADAENAHAALALLTASPIGTALYNGQTPRDARETFREAADWLMTHHGRLDVPWGEVNRLVRGPVSLPLSGGPDTLRAVYGERTDEGILRMVAGDGLVMLVEWAGEGAPASRSVHHFGSAVGRPGSPHYADQASLFAAEEMKPVPFTQEALEAAAVERYRPGERR